MMTDSFDAAVAEAEGGRSLDAFGNRYALRPQVGQMAILKLAKMASKGATTDDYGAAAALYDVIRSVFTANSWGRFEEDAIEANMDEDGLLAIVRQAIEVINGFPTMQSSPSLPSPSSITPSSTVSSFEERKRAAGMTPVTPESLRELVG
jgi:hypothetical protein